MDARNETSRRSPIAAEIGFNIHSVLLGSGIPVFHPMSRQIDLELLECRPFKNGCVFVTYRVKEAPGRPCRSAPSLPRLPEKANPRYGEMH